MSVLCWTPSPNFGQRIRHFMFWLGKRHDLEFDGDYEKLYRWSVDNLNRFWLAFFEYARVRCTVAPNQAVDLTVKMSERPTWFPECRFNYAENVLAGGRPEDLSVMSFCEQRDVVFSLSYGTLAEQVVLFASCLRQLGVSVGDRVAGLLPNCIETAICYLASAYIGAIWCSASPEFGAQGILQRFSMTQPKVIFAATHTVYRAKTFDQSKKLVELMQSSQIQPECLVLIPYVELFEYARPQTVLDCEKLTKQGVNGSASWFMVHDREYLDCRNLADESIKPYLDRIKHSMSLNQFINLAKSDLHSDPTQLPFSHPLTILFSSGTTGPPKCIVHSAGGTLIKHLCEQQLHCDFRPGSRLLYITNIGWMMWNWMISALASGTALVFYEGSPFDTGLWTMVDQLEVTILGVGAKWLAVLEDLGLQPGKTYNLTKLEVILSTGSPLAPRSFDFVYRNIKKDLLLGSISGGTDMIGCCVGCCPILRVYRGQIQCRFLGMAVESWDESGHPQWDKNGDLVITLPFPSMPVQFWGDSDGSKYRSAYFYKFPDVWVHGDFLMLHSETKGLTISGRSDATLNPSGIRFGSAEIYNLIESLSFVADSLCVAQSNRSRTDERVVLFVQLADQSHPNGPLLAELRDKLTQVIRSHLSPRFVPSIMFAVSSIPYTVNGKKVELAIRRLLEGQAPQTAFAKESLANAAVIDEYVEFARQIGQYDN